VTEQVIAITRCVSWALMPQKCVSGRGLVVLALAGQTNSATTLDLFLPTSGDRQTILRGHGGATRRPEVATWWLRRRQCV